MTDLHELPELPDDKAEKIKRNWLLYVLPLVFSLLTYVIEDYVKSRDAKPCNDLNVRLLNRIDSMSNNEIKYLEQELKYRNHEK